MPGANAKFLARFVTPALVAGIHVFLRRAAKTWMAGSSARRRASRFSPAMTVRLPRFSRELKIAPENCPCHDAA
jgi:hypothetical protein